MNKLSLCLMTLAIIFCFSNAQQAGGYNIVPSSNYSNSDIQNAMQFGIQNIISQAIKTGKIDNSYTASDFSVAQINKISEQVVSGMNYKFNLTLSSNDETLTINTNFVVYTQSWTNTTQLKTFTYFVKNNNVAGGYTTVPASEYENVNIQEFLHFGGEQVINQAINNSQIASCYDFSNFTLSTINSIETQVVSGTNYRYNLTIESDDNAITINTIFVVYNQAWTNTTTMGTIIYNVTYNAIGGYTVVPASNYTDADIQEFLQYGMDDVIARALKANKLPSSYNTSDFEVAQINSIQEQVVDGVNYRYDLVVKSSDNLVTIEALYIVYNQAWTNTTDMEYSMYTVIILPH